MYSLTTTDTTILVSIVGGIGVLLTAGRFFVHPGKRGASISLWADCLNAAAAVTLVAFLALELRFLSLSRAMELWVLKKGPRISLKELSTLYVVEFVGSILFWTTLYLVKFSILMLYRALFGISRSFRAAWWGVFTFTALTFLANLLSKLWMCGRPQDLLHRASCASSAAAANQHRLTILSVTLHVLSNAAIMALALGMLPRLHIPPARKLGLAAVFLLALADTAFDVLRGVASLTRALVTLFNALEPALALVVCALPVYHGAAARGAATGRAWLRARVVAVRAAGRGRGAGSADSDATGGRRLVLSEAGDKGSAGSDQEPHSAWLASASTGKSVKSSGDSLEDAMERKSCVDFATSMAGVSAGLDPDRYGS